MTSLSRVSSIAPTSHVRLHHVGDSRKPGRLSIVELTVTATSGRPARWLRTATSRWVPGTFRPLPSPNAQADGSGKAGPAALHRDPAYPVQLARALGQRLSATAEATPTTWLGSHRAGVLAGKARVEPRTEVGGPPNGNTVPPAVTTKWSALSVEARPPGQCPVARCPDPPFGAMGQASLSPWDSLTRCPRNSQSPSSTSSAARTLQSCGPGSRTTRPGHRCSTQLARCRCAVNVSANGSTPRRRTSYWWVPGSSSAHSSTSASTL
jgi:hypothetical protein